MSALQNERMDVVELLLKNNATVETKSVDGSTVLHFAVKMGSIELVQDLCGRGALMHINTVSDEYGTPLDQAIMFEQVELVKFLLDEMKAEKTAISDIHMNKNWEIFKFLKSKELPEKHIKENELEPIKNEKYFEYLIEKLKYDREFHEIAGTLELFEKLMKEKMEAENIQNQNE